MKLYKIRNWNDLFENNRSRTVKDLAWVAIPNRHDGENFSAIVTHKNGSEIFSAWILILQVASRCHPRGTLVRDNGKPHTATSLSVKTRAPESWFKKALDFLESDTDWIEIQQLTTDCQETVSVLSPSCQSPDEERRERIEGIEQNQREVLLLEYLNEKTGRKFRKSETSIQPITARLKEPDVTVDGIKLMIDRQVKRWRGTPQEEYLRPETLFGKQKFDSYYAAKDLPVNSLNGNGHQSTSNFDSWKVSDSK